MTKSLHRRIRKIPTRKVFVIVCEGSETEPIYFGRYRRINRYSNLRIEIPNKKCTDPKNLVKFSLEQIDKYQLDLKGGDVIWCAFDWDNRLQEDISTAHIKAKNVVKICFSNPSFELWYLLHFEYYCSKLSNDELIKKLKTHIPQYNKSRDYYDQLESRREDAIRYAKMLNDKHERDGTDLMNINSNPSTQVFKIVEELLKIINHSSL